MLIATRLFRSHIRGGMRRAIFQPVTGSVPVKPMPRRINTLIYPDLEPGSDWPRLGFARDGDIFKFRNGGTAWDVQKEI